VVGLARALVRLGIEVRLVSAAGDDRLSGDRLTAVAAGPPWRWPGRIGQTLQRLARAARAVDLVQLNRPTPAFAPFFSGCCRRRSSTCRRAWRRGRRQAGGRGCSGPARFRRRGADAGRRCSAR